MRKSPLLIYLLLLGLGLSSCQKKLHLVKSDPRYYTVDGESDRPASTELEQLLAPYQSRYNQTMNDVIGQLAVPLKKDKPESTLGNWMCDVLLEKARANAGVEVDFALQNYGGIRLPEISKGDITRSKIYELMPFDNMLVIVECSGDPMRTMLEKIAASGGVPVSKTLRMAINKNGEPEDVIINGIPFDPNQTYHVALPDYVATGSDWKSFLGELKRYDTGLFIRDLLIEGVEEAKGPIQVKLDGRISRKQ